jgi:hypothetical protein
MTTRMKKDFDYLDVFRAGKTFDVEVAEIEKLIRDRIEADWRDIILAQERAVELSKNDSFDPIELMAYGSTQVIASELEWLKFFYQEADFGPADDDVRLIIKERFESETGKRLPDGYRGEE